MSAGASLIPRAAVPLLDEVRAGYPVVTLTGPRKSGNDIRIRAICFQGRHSPHP